MLRILRERLHQKYRTLDFPRREPALSARYLGRPRLADTACGSCRACYEACPTQALLHTTTTAEARTPVLDMGRCIFCGACARVCPQEAIRFTQDYHVASRSRDGLRIRPLAPDAPTGTAASAPAQGRDLHLFRRSLKLRQVSAGGCNACEADCNVLGTLVYDLGRFGMDFVASPRHADGILVTGPVTENMRAALLDTWAATPEPRLVIAVGACAISGGLFRQSGQCHEGLAGCAGPQGPLPVDLWIPGCPPNPWSILDGLLSLRRA